MEQNERIRQMETRRLLEWISQNHNKWLEITLALTEENALVGQEIKETIRNLKENGFYQLLILLMYTRNDIIERALEKTILHSITQSWDDKSIDNIVNVLIDNIN